MKTLFSLKLYDNLLIVLFLFFLPFTYALTIKVGFPLKVSEIALFCIIAFFIIKGKFSVPLFHLRIFQVLSIFLFISFASTVVNIFSSYSYPMTNYVSRFGYKFDSILKFFYLLLAYLSFILATNVFYLNDKKFIKCFLYGSVAGSIYSWYLFFSGLLNIPELLLPGIEQPQYIAVSFGKFIRSGIFKEGNYMGLFLLFSVIISFYSNKKKLAFFFMATIITTFSSIAIVCTFIFFVCYYLKNFFNKKHLYRIIIFSLILIPLFIILIGNKDFKMFFLNKFSGNTTTISNSGEYSKVDRINLLLVGCKIGLSNPVFGVGMSNYSLHYNEYNTDKRFIGDNNKRIPNNVFVEVFSEIGLIGLIFFLYFLFLIYRQTKLDNSGVLRYGFIASLIYFLAFPTFTILFIWVCWGLIASLHNSLGNERHIY